ncbi:MAG TPA: hypothetical protein VJZ71_21280, partial [Phycisphaerae bacterium]|nr:hypothetical protein [Phycisphaerae bacterium]
CAAGICSNVFQDADSDGVCNVNDECPGTPPGEEPDADGCSCSQRDPDNDGVDDCDDDCANTPAGQPVNAQGCACSQVNCDDGESCTLDTCQAGVCSNVFQDADSDGVCDTIDRCPGFDDNLDTDGDGFPNGCDECPTENSSAVDFDEDGCLDGTFNLDIRPNQCPNSLTASSSGLMPAALLGMSGFDVRQVDVATLRLTRADIVSGEVAPHNGQASVGDAGAPTSQTLCACNDTNADGIDDLDVRFRLDDTIAALQLAGIPDYTEVPLKLKGQFLNGTPFAAIDCVTILPPTTEP